MTGLESELPPSGFPPDDVGKSWEARMAAQAAARNTAVAEQERLEDLADHAGHHVHVDGTATYCSCGDFLGVVSIAFEVDEDGNMIAGDPPTCTECGAEGTFMGPRR